MFRVLNVGSRPAQFRFSCPFLVSERMRLRCRHYLDAAREFAQHGMYIMTSEVDLVCWLVVEDARDMFQSSIESCVHARLFHLSEIKPGAVVSMSFTQGF
jgi:hypothetical protein